MLLSVGPSSEIRIGLFHVLYFWTNNHIYLLNCRTGGNKLWEPKAQHWHPQVHFCALQAEAKADCNCTFLQGSFQHPSVCWAEWPRPPCGCCLLQLSERNCCQEALKIPIHVVPVITNKAYGVTILFLKSMLLCYITSLWTYASLLHYLLIDLQRIKCILQIVLTRLFCKQ